MSSLSHGQTAPRTAMPQLTSWNRSWLRTAMLLLLLSQACGMTTSGADRPADPKANWKPEDGDDDRWNEMNIGPFIHSVLKTPGGTIAKGLSIRVGDPPVATVAYDTQTGSMRAAWTGGFVRFHPRKFGVVVAPAIDGTVTQVCSKPAWGNAKVEYGGFYQQERRVVLSYHVAGTNVLESPWAVAHDDGPVVLRFIEVRPHASPLSLTLLTDCESFSQDGAAIQTTAGGLQQAVVLADASPGVSLREASSSLQVELRPSKAPQRFRIAICSGKDVDTIALSKSLDRAVDKQTLAALERPAARLWQRALETNGTLGTENGPFQIDTCTLPFDNPYKALFFVSGHDFLSNGDAAICTLHGDVWTVSGIDDDLDKLTWRRYATGLHQPLGLRIVDDKVYVLGRDQITRLHDRNQDGEADFYENFNNDGQTSTSGHDYASCLETDATGNFYYIRAHEGVVKVSADGKQHRSIAKGFRNPVGLGVGPDGTITASPQEGNWTPASAIFEVKDGGYYGFGGPQVTPDRPLGYDPPLCWLPRLQDNSSGGQVWVTSDRWAPLQGKMLHLSYGQCMMLLTMSEHVDGIPQGGTYQFPYYFNAGVMRGRFSPHDGQLYLSGLRGWQTSAVKDGCLQRVRYTGRPLYIPTSLTTHPKGVKLTFSEPLDPETAGDPDNYSVEWWNYQYSKEYGSKDYRVSNPKRFGRDEVYVENVRLSDDGHSVWIELEEILPVMQMQITYNIKANDGQPLKQTIYNTINKVPTK